MDSRFSDHRRRSNDPRRSSKKDYISEIKENPKHTIKDITNDHEWISKAQQMIKWKPDLIVLGPGGVKGLLEVSSLILLDQLDILSNVTTFVGVSIGSIIALLCVLGYTPAEIALEFYSRNLMQDLKAQVGMDTNSMISSMVECIKKVANDGLIGNIIEDLLNEKCKQKLGLVPSLNGLRMATGKDLHLLVTGIKRLKDEVFLSAFTYPDISCVKAVMMSSTLPGISSGLSKIGSIDGEIMLDGAFSNPLPFLKFDDGKTKILTLSISVDSHCTDPLSIAIQVNNIVSDKYKKLQIQFGGNMCKHLELFYDDLEISTISSNNKGKMLLSGYVQTYAFIMSNLC